MVDRDLVASKLSELGDHLARVRARRKATVDELGRARDALATRSTWLLST
jgi:hypothetical protein